MKDRYSKEQLVLQKLLKKLRQKAQLTQIELAAALNMPQSFVSKYETGERHLEFLEIQEICASYDISITEFSKLYEKELKNES